MKYKFLSAMLVAPVLFGALSISSAMPETAVQPLGDQAYVGKVTGWSIAADGAVAVKLEGSLDKKAFALWFATPANLTDTTRYEDLVLAAVLALQGSLKDTPVTILSKDVRNDTGKTVEDALPLDGMRQE